MNIIIQNSDTRPIYSQIEEQIKATIISGQLAEGDALPSMRVLSKELRISMITIKRAYEDLERDGFIYTVAGKGCFVAAKNIDIVREGNLREMEASLEKASQLAKMCNVSLEDMIAILTEIYE